MLDLISMLDSACDAQDLNKIAFRIENQYAYCFGLTTPTRITAAARNTFKQVRTPGGLCVDSAAQRG